MRGSGLSEREGVGLARIGRSDQPSRSIQPIRPAGSDPPRNRSGARRRCGSLGSRSSTRSHPPIEVREHQDVEELGAGSRARLGDPLAAAPARRVSLPEATLSNRGSACLLRDLQPEQDLVAVNISGWFEAVSLVERDRAALALPGARPHRVDAPIPEVLDDQVECCCTEASSLVALVDEQLSRINGRCSRGCRPRQRSSRTRPASLGFRSPSKEKALSVRLLRRLENRLADTAHKPFLIRRYGRDLDRLPIRVGHPPERKPPCETGPTHM
jgi:hypothetical protein